MACLAIGVVCASSAAQQPGASKPPPTAMRTLTLREILADRDRVSYAIGVTVGRSLQGQAREVKVESLARGIKDALAGVKLRMTDREIKQVVIALQTEDRRRRAQERSKAMEAARKEAAANEKAGVEFLARNKVRQGVVTTPSGLQYEVLQAGEGRRPGATDAVEVHYRGTLIDGTEFDNSRSRGGPTLLRVDGVVRGWSEALKLMPAGSRWRLWLPPNLAYGNRAAGPKIGPNSVLIFDVELLSVK
jgi:FKBP-type peptidyl-prolyl cis-trans isomerase FklB